MWPYTPSSIPFSSSSGSSYSSLVLSSASKVQILTIRRAAYKQSPAFASHSVCCSAGAYELCTNIFPPKWFCKWPGGHLRFLLPCHVRCSRYFKELEAEVLPQAPLDLLLRCQEPCEMLLSCTGGWVLPSNELCALYLRTENRSALVRSLASLRHWRFWQSNHRWHFLLVCKEEHNQVCFPIAVLSLQEWQ